MKKSILFAIPFAFLACTPSTNIKEPIEDRQMSKGRISIPLVSTSSSGTMYFLHLPSVILESEDNRQELSFEEQEELNVSLDVGDYSLSIHDWALYQIEEDELIPVNAELISDNPQMITISGGETTHTVIRFRTEGAVVPFENGDLTVQIEVEEGQQEDQNNNTSVPIQCGEETFDGNKTITNQDELTQFFINHGAINGTLTLEGQDIIDASALSCLNMTSLIVEDTLIDNIVVKEQEFLHILKIQNNPNLSYISAPTEELDHVTITRNEQLWAVEIDASSGYGFIFRNNPELQSINAPFLEELEGDLFIEDNHLQENIDFSSLQYIGNRIIVSNNVQLTDIQLPLLNMTGGYISIEENESLEQIELPSLFGIGDPTRSGSTTADLRIQNNENLVSMNAPELFFISRNLNILNNAMLENLDSFNQLITVNEVNIRSNLRLRDILGLSGVTDAYRLSISFNPHLPEDMVNYLYEVEIGEESVQDTVQISNNSSVSTERYDLSSCNAQYVTIESGEFFPAGSMLNISTSENECTSIERTNDGALWTINGDCNCN